MSHLITSQLVAAYQECPRKAFFLLRGSPEPHPHEYEIVVEERAAKRRIAYLADLELQKPVVISADDLHATCDALTHGRKRGQREPHWVIGTETPSLLDKARLAFAGYALGQESRRRPSVGVIVPFSADPKRLKLDPLYAAVSKSVNVLHEWTRQLPSEPPACVMGNKCQTCEFRDYCHAEAEKADSLYLLDKMTPKVAAKYQKKGIFTLTQLSYVYRPRRRPKKSVGTIRTPFNVELQSLAIREKKVYLHERPALAQQPVELFLDIEGVPDQDFNYLVGVMVKKGDKTTMHPFWANGSDDESRIFTECSALAAKYPDAPIYHYGHYERRAIERVAEKYGLNCKALLARLVNVNGIVYGKVYFPTRSNRLKDLGAAVGASWPTPNPSGIESIAWRWRWEDSRQADFKAKLLAYNQADCNALRLLTAELQSLSKAADSRADVDFTNKPKQLATPTGEHIHRLFDGILASAHDEYRRKKIALSGLVTPDKLASQSAPARKSVRPKKLNRPSKTIVVPRRRRGCSNHPEVNLRKSRKTSSHKVIDLVFTKTGCRKRVVKYVGHMAFCPQCTHLYSPHIIACLKNSFYGHSFRSWLIYQRVVLRLPLAAIEQSCEVLFAEHISQSGIGSIVTQFTRQYARSDRLLLENILASHFCHVDETKINIHGANQYVFVLTDGRHVVFRLSPTRETALVQDILQGYDGVLVSDFYGGYDAMQCRQQKCWSHLIRDLNDDLWKNPFLEEYEQFVVHVRNLVLPIFQDVLSFGLKSRYLRKHMKCVDRFYRQHIDGVRSNSEIVLKYQKRFERYRDALFLFLRQDGLSWNNNMAERAIRHFAVQRKISATAFSETGATEYLTLLGIAQSCRFQEKSFLRFLLSEEKDVDAFKDRRRRR
ncbi:MAG: IS66 family transposase [Pirellulales bacterium]